MAQNVRPAGRVVSGDSIAIVGFAVSVVVGTLLMAGLWVELSSIDDAATTDGRDMCVMLDDRGKRVNHTFVGADAPCPAPTSDGWRVSARITHSGLVVYDSHAENRRDAGVAMRIAPSVLVIPADRLDMVMFYTWSSFAFLTSGIGGLITMGLLKYDT